MNRFQSLNRTQKCVLILLAIMTLVFTVVYAGVSQRVGYLYRDAILVPTYENNNTVYTGKIHNQSAQFTVSQNDTVIFQYGSQTYGPYTIITDSTAVPVDSEFSKQMTGKEIRKDDKILFRGGFFESDSSLYLFNEDGTVNKESFGITFVTDGGIEYDEQGNEIDPMEPTAYTLLELTNNPVLSHKGNWIFYFCGVLLCVLNAVSLLFINELFHWNLSFQIRNSHQSEPSDFEIARRYIGWTCVAVIAFFFFTQGLK